MSDPLPVSDSEPTPEAGDAQKPFEDAEQTEQTEQTADADPPARATRWWLRGRVFVPVMVLLTAAAVTIAVLVIRRGDSTPSATDPNAGLAAAASGFVAGASSDVAAVTAYDYRSLDVVLGTGLQVTTGSYRQAFRAALTGSLATTARKQQIVQTFDQDAAGIGAISRDRTTAKVLIFGRQTVTRGGGTPQTTPVTLTATMVKHDDRYLISALDAGTNPGIPGGNASLAAAAEAARRQTVASLTLRHDHADADYDAALADTIDPLRSSLASSLAATRTDVERGGYDLSGRVTAVAIESAAANRPIVVLVAATGAKSANGATSVVADERLRVVVAYVDGAWRVANSQPVGS